MAVVKLHSRIVSTFYRLIKWPTEGAVLSGATAHEHCGNRLRQNRDVMKECSPANVGDVHANPFGECDAAAAAHLPDAREAGRDVEATALPAFAGIGFIDRQRSRADERHVAAQHIPELRQLVDAGLAEKFSDA